MKSKSNPVRIVALVLGLIGLAELAVGLLYFSMNNAAYFNLLVYPSMTEAEVRAVKGASVKIFHKGEEEGAHITNLNLSFRSTGSPNSGWPMLLSCSFGCPRRLERFSLIRRDYLRLRLRGSGHTSRRATKAHHAQRRRETGRRTGRNLSPDRPDRP
jgi:hypothetical protein